MSSISTPAPSGAKTIVLGNRLFNLNAAHQCSSSATTEQQEAALHALVGSRVRVGEFA